MAWDNDGYFVCDVCGSQIKDEITLSFGAEDCEVKWKCAKCGKEYEAVYLRRRDCMDK